MVIAIMVVSVVMVAIVMIAIMVIDVMMVAIVMVIFHHMFKVPARLLIIVLERLVIFVNQASIADAQAGIARLRSAIMVTVAVPDVRAIATVPLARVMDVAVVLAVPRFKMTVVVAPPIAIVAIFGAAPPTHIGFAFAEAMLDVAFVPTIPSMPVTFVMAARTFAAAIIFAMTATIAVATVMELDRRDRVERIEQDRIDHCNPAVLIRAACVARNRARGREHDQRGCDGAEERLPHPEFAHRFDTLRHGDLP